MKLTLDKATRVQYSIDLDDEEKREWGHPFVRKGYHPCSSPIYIQSIPSPWASTYRSHCYTST